MPRLEQSAAHVEALAGTIRQRDEALESLVAVVFNNLDIIRQREANIGALRADLLVASSTIERRDAELVTQARELTASKLDRDNVRQDYNRAMEENRTLLAKMGDVQPENTSIVKSGRILEESSNRQHVVSTTALASIAVRLHPKAFAPLSPAQSRLLSQYHRNSKPWRLQYPSSVKNRSRERPQLSNARPQSSARSRRNVFLPQLLRHLSHPPRTLEWRNLRQMRLWQFEHSPLG